MKHWHRGAKKRPAHPATRTSYRRKYRQQVGISIAVFSLFLLTISSFIQAAAPEATYVEVTSDADWNMGTLSDVTVNSGSIEISGDGGANWIAESGWQLRQKITFDASTLTTSLSYFPIMVHIDNTNTDFWAGAASRDEVRFGDSDGAVLDFHFEKFDHTADDAIAWVEVPTLTNDSSDHIYLYYGHASPANGEDEAGTYDNDGNFVGVWHMAETSGTSYDSTSNNVDLTPRNAPTQDETGKVNGGDGFTGNGDALHNQTSSIVFGNSITLEGWFKRTGSGTGSGRILEFSLDGDADSHALAVDSDGSLRAWVQCTTGRVGSADDPTVYGTGTWYYFAYTYDGSIGRLYVNGVQKKTASGSCANLDDAGDTILGAISDQSGAYSLPQHEFDGYLDEHRASDVARSADWIKAAYLSETDTLISTWGSEESALQSPGTYTSHNLDLQYIYQWGDCASGCNDSSTAFTTNITVPSNTSVQFELRHSADGSTNWSSWTSLATYTSSGTKTLTRGEMVTLVGDIFNRYVQTRITLSSSDGSSNPSIADYRYDYTRETDPPSNPNTQNGYASNGGAAITSGNWYNHPAPYFTWSGASDTDAGMSGGYSGYWVCFGTSSCEPTSGTFVSSAAYTAGSLTTNTTYYLRIKARDAAGNVATSAYDAFTYKYDATPPANPSGILPDPAGFTNVNDFDFTWNTGSDAGGSGIAEYCYKTGEDGYVETCTASTSVTGITAYQEGANIFYVRSKDIAGNLPTFYTQVSYYYSANAPSPPQGLAVDPTENTANSFTFTWLAPASYSNPIATYHYSVNALPTASNTTATTNLSVGPGAFATQQGTNIFYVVAKDTAGNVEWDSYAAVEFTANTTAPGIPTGVTLTDSSIRAQNKYSLTLTWDAPENEGSGIDHYVIDRSTTIGCSDGSGTWVQHATTTAEGYFDPNLSNTTTYCYRVKAADNAGAQSATSSIVSMRPEGRFTEPPELIGSPGVEAYIQSATIEWLTDREANSFVEFGVASDTLDRIMGQDDFVSSHTVQLLDLEPATTYYYRTKHTDQDSNTGYSTILSFSTADALCSNKFDREPRKQHTQFIYFFMGCAK
ncbi:MAG: DUF2341 domain-containing protein [Candidatus Nomurabacteria bacterium]|nr:MAG: DUF2341 domain-containing protein [Candidatus Nomurabacteria bacterium]